MHVELVVEIVAASIWLGAEAYLIVKDNAHGKGTTDVDRRTRGYNTAATVISLTLGLAVNGLTMLRIAPPAASVLFWTGIVMMPLGFFLRHWSIITLGRYFRTTVELEEGQKVVEKGPYRFIRHPSYAGLILFFVGYGMITSNWLSLIASICLPAAAMVYRIRIEEPALAKGLGPAYVAYQKRTKRLIPGVW